MGVGDSVDDPGWENAGSLFIKDTVDQPFHAQVAHPLEVKNVLILQWDLFIKDTLGPANMSTVERLSTLQR